MKRASLIILIVGAFFILIAVALNGYLIQNDQKAKMQKVRDAKAKKKAEAQKEIEEEIKNVLDATEEITNGKS